ncbi:hypothetical protein FLONG3_6198 [Fusarium longipes]|uniref:Uncharacterized protein n=1 Tax=Fusarium longipes TaxID=694270 RepID=A0A395SNR2_9HYPO|nr:hypothetical protein FLONG3_6198 [Fusarium longipes]
MDNPLNYERRERPSRAAAPTKNMKDPDSEDDDKPIKPRVPSSAEVIRSDSVDTSPGSSLVSSPDSITVISRPNSALSMATLNRPSSPKKRNSTENESDSPTKKARRIVLKTSKSSQAVTPVPSQAEDASSTPSIVSEMDTVVSYLKSLQQQVIQREVDHDQDKKKLASIEQALQDARAGKSNLSQSDDLHIRKENQELHEENQELAKQVSRLKHKVSAMRYGSIDPDGFKVMDFEVQNEWNGIAFDIRNFVFQVLTKRPYRESAPRGANQNDVQALKKHLAKDADTAPYHFQRYIWLHLIKDVFQAGKATWGGPAGNAFHRYCLDISEIDFVGMEKLSQFKAGQAAMLSKSFDENNREQAKDIAREMALTLDIFMDLNEKGKENGQCPKKRLMAIVRKAVELNDVFLRSRAFFLTNWLMDDFEWADVKICHRSGETDGEEEVDIEISPRLRKIGNADGRKFHQALELCKPMVTVVHR